jgi:hypothetical protein
MSVGPTPLRGAAIEFERRRGTDGGTVISAGLASQRKLDAELMVGWRDDLLPSAEAPVQTGDGLARGAVTCHMGVIHEVPARLGL